MPSNSLAARAADVSTPPTPMLEARLQDLITHHLGLQADQLVGFVSRIDDLRGEPDAPPIHARAWLGAPGKRGPRLGRTFRVDPYSLQVLIDDARRTGRGARLDLVVSASSPAAHVEAIRRRLAVLARHGVDVRVRLQRKRRSYSFLYAL
jgi:hypothetical protein